ncbi:MAG: hypothetical protein ACOH2M_22880 [Cypionkella sp.]
MPFDEHQADGHSQALYDKAIAELKAQGAIVVTGPFAGTDFAALAVDRFGLGTKSWVSQRERASMASRRYFFATSIADIGHFR